MKKLFVLFASLFILFANNSFAEGGEVLVLDMEMGIFPGTSEYLQSAIDDAKEKDATVLGWFLSRAEQ